MSVTYFINTFNGFPYVNGTGEIVANMTDVITGRQRVTASPNLPGRKSHGSIPDSRKITLEGIFVPTDNTPAGTRTGWDAFRTAHIPGAPAKLFIDDDRYIYAEVETLTDSNWTGGPFHVYSISFICHNPFWLAVTPSTYTLDLSSNTGSTTGIVTAGNYFTYLDFTIQVSGLTAGSYFTVSNSLSGDVLNFYPPFADTFTFNSWDEKVTGIIGSYDYTNTGDYVLGDFLTLAPGTAPTISFTTTGTMTLSNPVFTWIDRIL